MKGQQIAKSLRFKVFARDNFACVYCGGRGEGYTLHVDHATPRIEGGTNDIGNLVTACTHCNFGKGRKHGQPNLQIYGVNTPGRIVAIVDWTPADVARRPMLRIAHALLTSVQSRFMDLPGVELSDTLITISRLMVQLIDIGTMDTADDLAHVCGWPKDIYTIEETLRSLIVHWRRAATAD